ncbi:CRISPR-associated protein Cas4 [Stappia sp. GBMRC 2046]|uniref:CRISPR-associated exonuclease Cas4 n=1 Tax=Stappia sediminis TaxID=2692190 RepID=A0A7X3LY11_9HYPH|nr:CRISPR-associated protein Cas4 [Stappia sediminis]MXN67128.1 CRISPR-associated protein Cas4 [Stappia sediminis]
MAAEPEPTEADGERAGEPIPLSALQHAVYCLRQAALIHLERLWAENRFTAEGQILHVNADKAASRKTRGVRRETALQIASKRLGVAGVADLVEFHKAGEEEVPFPVEFKRGKPKPHRADEVQLCAQALCLEETTGRPVPEGALFYGETKRRVTVPFDEELRRLTEATIAELREVFAILRTPVPVYRAARCRACSLKDICRPQAVTRSAASWRKRMLDEHLTENEAGR